MVSSETGRKYIGNVLIISKFMAGCRYLSSSSQVCRIHNVECTYKICC